MIYTAAGSFEAWHVNEDKIEYGVVRNGMCEVHWKGVYWNHGGMGSTLEPDETGLMLKYKALPKNKPISPAFITGVIEFNGFKGKISRLKSKTGRGGQRSWEMVLEWETDEGRLGDEGILEVSVDEDPNGYPYLLISFSDFSGSLGSFDLCFMCKRNSGDLTQDERLNLGLRMPGKKFLGHISVKHGRLYEYDPANDNEEIGDDEDEDEEGDDEDESNEEEQYSPRNPGAQEMPHRKAMGLTRTLSVESWYVDSDKVNYGFALKDAPPLSELLRNPTRKGNKCEVRWDFVYCRTDYTTLDPEELGYALELEFEAPKAGKEIAAMSIKGHIRLNFNYYKGNITNVSSGIGLNGQKTWKLNIEPDSENMGDDMGSTAIEVGTVEDANGHPFIYCGFLLDSWCPIHLIGKRHISKNDSTNAALTDEERRNLGLKMAGKRFLQHARTRLGHDIKYDSDLDDMVSLYDDNGDGDKEGDMDMDETYDVANLKSTDKKRKRADDEPEAANPGKRLKK